MQYSNLSWGSDVPISMPEPMRKDQHVLVDMGHFCFTETGIAHNLNFADLEDYLFPTFAPLTIPDYI